MRERDTGPDEPGQCGVPSKRKRGWSRRRDLALGGCRSRSSRRGDRSQCFNWVELPFAGSTDVAEGEEQELLRKEVIQPHLPVRLPCYDFTPITDPTFDGSLPKGLGHRLRVLPTFVV